MQLLFFFLGRVRGKEERQEAEEKEEEEERETG